MIGGDLMVGSMGIQRIHFNGSATPTFIVNPDGSLKLVKDDTGVATKVADYTVVVGDSGSGYYIDATGGNITITLPAWGAAVTQRYWFRRIDTSGNTVTIQTASGSDFLYNQEANTTTLTRTLVGQYASITTQRISSNRFRYYYSA
jgi:hypothetical protein